MKSARASLLGGLVVFVVGCGGEVTTGTADGAVPGDAARVADGGESTTRDGGPAIDAEIDAGTEADAGVPDGGAGPCVTTITYGDAWIRPDGHAGDVDRVDGEVTWDGTCAYDGASSYATLSNGWRPYFRGRSSCVIALDTEGACTTPRGACATRVSYGATWLAPDGHDARFDDVAGAVTWNGVCRAAATGSAATLSNGWVPHFSGASACDVSLRYTECGGLYANPVVGEDCPNPGVLRDGDHYVVACTGGAFALRTSPDLVHFTRAGAIFAAGAPGWASGDFWAPEIHRVGDRYVAYFSARARADGRLSVGAATADDALGPYTDLGHPLVSGIAPGAIDAHHFEAPDGRHFLLYKVDGNAVGARTPIRIQELAADGVTLVGAPTDILTNDRAWEGAVVEGPWMIHEGGYYYLFYSGNAYYDARYATGVARATSPLGPFEKHPTPIVTSNAWFSGPGHGSVVRGPRGGWVYVHHAWRAGAEGGPPGRTILVEPMRFADGWPTLLSAPNPRSQPLP